MRKEKVRKRLKYTLPVLLVIGMLIAVFATPIAIIPEVKEGEIRSWKSVTSGALGDLDTAYGAGNTTILGIWVVNHTENPEDWLDGINNTAGTEINASNTVYGYAQGSSFDIEIPHTTNCDILIYVRANATNAATGSAATDQFNDTWVMVNFTTGDGLGCQGGHNLTSFVTHNVSGDPAMYILFVYNSTDIGVQTQEGWNDAMTGTGFQLVRDNRSYITSIDLLCYY